MNRNLGLMSIVLTGTMISCGGYSERPKPTPPSSAPAPAPKKLEGKAAIRVQFANKLWSTTLGRMYESFLTSSNDREELPARAQQIVDKLLANTDHTVARVAAIQMMNEDLYVKGKINDDVLTRIALLEQEMAKGRQKVEKSTIMRILGEIPFLFLAAIPIGSPLFRTEFRNLLRGYGLRIVAWIRRGPAPPAPIVQWRRLGSRDFFKDYEIGKPMDAFAKTAIPLALLEWWNTERKIQGSSEDLTPAEIETTANF